jgi:DNA-binding response OmpR family regulator
MMPGFSGMELRETIVSEQAEYASRFVFMTGGAYTQESQEYLESAGVPVIAKPFTPATLVALVQAHLDA